MQQVAAGTILSVANDFSRPVFEVVSGAPFALGFSVVLNVWALTLRCLRDDSGVYAVGEIIDGFPAYPPTVPRPSPLPWGPAYVFGPLPGSSPAATKLLRAENASGNNGSGLVSAFDFIALSGGLGGLAPAPIPLPL